MAAYKPIDWSRFDHLEDSDDEDPAPADASRLLSSMVPGSSAVICSWLSTIAQPVSDPPHSQACLFIQHTLRLPAHQAGTTRPCYSQRLLTCRRTAVRS